MIFNAKNTGGLVYSTDHGRMCPDCGKPVDNCICKQQSPAYTGDGIVRVSRQTKGRKGKGVTIITGLELTPAEIKKLARELKAKCGCGGTVKDGIIEIQGEKRDQIVEELKKKGFQVKKAGG